MINDSFNWASIVGIALMIASLWTLSIDGKIKRGYDVIIALVLFVDGLILFFQGWRLDPISQFAQFLFAALVLFISYENLRLRKSFFRLLRSSREKIEEKEGWPEEEMIRQKAFPDLRLNDSLNQRELSTDHNKSDNAKKYHRNIGVHRYEDLELMEDNDVYEIIKLHLLGISNGDIKPEPGEVQYLQEILNDMNINK